MDTSLKQKLTRTAQKQIGNDDPSHDFNHTLRVLSAAETIGKAEHGDLEILTAAALFHDAVTYEKTDPRNKFATDESAEFARKVLTEIPEFPQAKVDAVCKCILTCSFSKGIIPDDLNARILQDADRLEATGAISIMRTFATSGKMGRPFYNPVDPFCEQRTPEDLSFGVDLFYSRLLKVGDLMHTETARTIAKRRTEFLKQFLEEFKHELNETA